ncbi:hypothetical protein [Trujillonella endophytica]|uniref:Uncharacterized protein n=1 Tax=Trujillonella endophytica TaxID=673521 RepID=A0A1H8RHU7_9ACTN|nr:hypothetical protein [Trujillella endophytica]SEO65892.1 hypothetical protein SAMN05660991_01115 [Trujillella endophytica]
MEHVEPGGSWRPFWLVAGALGLLLVLDVALPGPDVPPLLWVLSLVAVLGVVAAGVLSANRVWTVRVGRTDVGEPVLSVGRERVLVADVDTAHLEAVREGAAGVDAGAPVLGGGWSLPRGRTGLPLRLTDGRTVLVPTRDPAALARALLAAAPARGAVPGAGETGASPGSPRTEGTLGP